MRSSPSRAFLSTLLLATIPALGCKQAEEPGAATRPAPIPTAEISSPPPTPSAAPNTASDAAPAAPATAPRPSAEKALAEARPAFEELAKKLEALAIAAVTDQPLPKDIPLSRDVGKSPLFKGDKPPAGLVRVAFAMTANALMREDGTDKRIEMVVWLDEKGPRIARLDVTGSTRATQRNAAFLEPAVQMTRAFVLALGEGDVDAPLGQLAAEPRGGDAGVSRVASLLPQTPPADVVRRARALAREIAEPIGYDFSLGALALFMKDRQGALWGLKLDTNGPIYDLVIDGTPIVHVTRLGK